MALTAAGLTAQKPACISGRASKAGVARTATRGAGSQRARSRNRIDTAMTTRENPGSIRFAKTTTSACRTSAIPGTIYVGNQRLSNLWIVYIHVDPALAHLPHFGRAWSGPHTPTTVLTLATAFSREK